MKTPVFAATCLAAIFVAGVMPVRAQTLPFYNSENDEAIKKLCEKHGEEMAKKFNRPSNSVPASEYAKTICVAHGAMEALAKEGLRQRWDKIARHPNAVRERQTDRELFRS
jgi:hypothetical protein